MLSLLHALIALLRPTDALLTAGSQHLLRLSDALLTASPQHLLRPTDAYKQIREASPLSFALLAVNLPVHTLMQAWLLVRKVSGSAYTRKKTSSRKRTRPMCSLTTCYDVPPSLNNGYTVPDNGGMPSFPTDPALRFPLSLNIKKRKSASQPCGQKSSV